MASTPESLREDLILPQLRRVSAIRPPGQRPFQVIHASALVSVDVVWRAYVDWIWLVLVSADFVLLVQAAVDFVIFVRNGIRLSYLILAREDKLPDPT